MRNCLRILLVDDRPAVLLTYRMILQQQGHEVTAVPSYGDAVASLDSCSFDLLLCDLGLGDNRNGFDVIEHAREKVPGIRAVLLTGFADQEVAEQAAERGVTVLFKPVNVHELLNTVHGSGSAARAIA